MLLQPWFLQKRVAIAVRALLPPHYRRRLRDCFDDYGCLRCDRLNVAYRSNGLCAECFMKIIHRLKTSAERRGKDRPSHGYGRRLLEEVEQARKLLREFIPKDRAAPGTRQGERARGKNPVEHLPIVFSEPNGV